MGYGPRNLRLVEAFGQSKTIREWTEDPRCSIGYNALHLRLHQGWDAEEAIGAPEHKGQKFEAFGEWKTLSQWAQDPRCAVEFGVLAGRLHREWNFERALTLPARVRAKPKSVSPKRVLLPGPTAAEFHAFGETKSLKEWATDPRCVVPYYLLRNRLYKGWALEDAVVVPIGSGSPIPKPSPIDAEHRTAHKSKRVSDADTYSAFGKKKTLKEWAEDPHCAVILRVLKIRLRQGLDFKTALTAKHLTPGSGPKESYMAFGETKTLGEWSKDLRCVVPWRVLRTRLSRGVPPEEALTRPEIEPRQLIAFGDQKPLASWLMDPRCQVGKSGLARRLAEGWSDEAAISAPRRSVRSGKKEPVRPAQTGE